MCLQNRRLRPKSCLDSLREFLTPAIWKQAHQQRRAQRASPRWATEPLILTLLIMTWCCGDSQAERFEAAKAFTTVCLTKRRRPGQSVEGFHQALAKLPMAALRAVAAGVRRRLGALVDLSDEQGWRVFGCDGTNLACPRTAELEQRLDPPRKQQAGPQIWVTALVHLRTGLLWAWHLGKGYNRERNHLRKLLTTLPPCALVVADAGYNGYELGRALAEAGVSFVIRMSRKDTLYVQHALTPARFAEGEVMVWPQTARNRRQPPLRCRLFRLKRKQGPAVWLLSNVLDPNRLSRDQAKRYYRWRWENETLFRTYKRTLAKVKILSRTVALAHREVEGSLLATQLLLAQGVRALTWWTRKANAAPAHLEVLPRCSPRKILLALRAELGHRHPTGSRSFQKRLRRATREHRYRTTAKLKRPWPTRCQRKPPAPPRFLKLNDRLKRLLLKVEMKAA
jgi:Transposase DDE domain